MEKNIREEILRVLQKPSSVTEIKNQIPKIKSFGSLAYHLNNLVDEGIITKQKETKKQGQPTIYKIESKEVIKELEDQKKEDDKQLRLFLEYLKENPNVEHSKMVNDLKNKGIELWWDFITGEAIANNLSFLCYKITPKGEKFLKDKRLIKPNKKEQNILKKEILNKFSTF